MNHREREVIKIKKIIIGLTLVLVLYLAGCAAPDEAAEADPELAESLENDENLDSELFDEEVAQELDGLEDFVDQI